MANNCTISLDNSIREHSSTKSYLKYNNSINGVYILESPRIRTSSQKYNVALNLANYYNDIAFKQVGIKNLFAVNLNKYQTFVAYDKNDKRLVLFNNDVTKLEEDSIKNKIEEEPIRNNRDLAYFNYDTALYEQEEKNDNLLNFNSFTYFNDKLDTKDHDYLSEKFKELDNFELLNNLDEYSLINHNKAILTTGLKVEISQESGSAFDPTTNSIVIDINEVYNMALEAGISFNTMFNIVYNHELGHSLSVYYLSKNNETNEVALLFNEVLELNKINPYIDKLRYNATNQRGFDSIEEFVAEAYSNPFFRQWLATNKYQNTNLSFWEKLKMLIKNYLSKFGIINYNNNTSLLEHFDYIFQDKIILENNELYFTEGLTNTGVFNFNRNNINNPLAVDSASKVLETFFSAENTGKKLLGYTGKILLSLKEVKSKIYNNLKEKEKKQLGATLTEGIKSIENTIQNVSLHGTSHLTNFLNIRNIINDTYNSLKLIINNEDGLLTPIEIIKAAKNKFDIIESFADFQEDITNLKEELSLDEKIAAAAFREFRKEFLTKEKLTVISEINSSKIITKKEDLLKVEQKYSELNIDNIIKKELDSTLLQVNRIFDNINGNINSAKALYNNKIESIILEFIYSQLDPLIKETLDTKTIEVNNIQFEINELLKNTTLSESKILKLKNNLTTKLNRVQAEIYNLPISKNKILEKILSGSIADISNIDVLFQNNIDSKDLFTQAIQYFTNLKETEDLSEVTNDLNKLQTLADEYYKNKQIGLGKIEEDNNLVEEVKVIKSITFNVEKAKFDAAITILTKAFKGLINNDYFFQMDMFQKKLIALDLALKEVLSISNTTEKNKKTQTILDAKFLLNREYNTWKLNNQAPKYLGEAQFLETIPNEIITFPDGTIMTYREYTRDIFDEIQRLKSERDRSETLYDFEAIDELIQQKEIERKELAVKQGKEGVFLKIAELTEQLSEIRKNTSEFETTKEDLENFEKLRKIKEMTSEPERYEVWLRENAFFVPELAFFKQKDIINKDLAEILGRLKEEKDKNGNLLFDIKDRLPNYLEIGKLTKPYRDYKGVIDGNLVKEDVVKRIVVLQKMEEQLINVKKLKLEQKQNKVYLEYRNKIKQLLELTKSETTEAYDTKIELLQQTTRENVISQNEEYLNNFKNGTSSIKKNKKEYLVIDNKLHIKINGEFIETFYTTIEDVLELYLADKIKENLQGTKWFQNNHIIKARNENREYDNYLIDFEEPGFVYEPIYIWKVTKPTQHNVEWKPKNNKFTSFKIKQQFINLEHINESLDIINPKQGTNINEEYKNLLQKDKIFLDFVLNMYLNYQKKAGSSRGYLLPAIRKSFNDKLVNNYKSPKLFISNILETVKETFGMTDQVEDDIAFGAKVSNIIKKVIPLRYDSYIEAKEQSGDFISTLMQFMVHSKRRESLLDDQSLVESMKDIFKNKKRFVEKNGKLIEEKGKVRQRTLSFEEMINRIYYGETAKNVDQSTTKTALVVVNLIKRISNFTSFLFKPASALKNSVGSFLQKTIQVDDKTGLKGLIKAEMKVGYIIKNMISDVGKAGNRSLIGQLLLSTNFMSNDEMYNIFNERQTNIIDGVSGVLFLPKRLSELYQNLATFLQGSYMYQALDKDNKPVPFHEIFEKNEKGELKIKEGIQYIINLNKDGTFNTRPYTNADKNIVVEKLKKYSDTVQGSYRKSSRTNFEKDWYGKLIMTYKNFLPNFLRERYSHRRFSIVNNDYEMGSWYIAFYEPFIKNKGFDKVKFLANYNNMTAKEKAMARKAMRELSITLILLILTKLVLGWDDDDKKTIEARSNMLNLFIYGIMGGQSEFHTTNLLGGTDEFARMYKRPFVGATQLESLLKIMPQLSNLAMNSKDAYYKTNGYGYKKGDIKAFRTFLNLVGIKSNFGINVDYGKELQKLNRLLNN